MKRAFIYPGQGAQTVCMGIDVAKKYSEAGAVFDQATELAGYDMMSLCGEGPEDVLCRTCYTQPAMFTVEAAITDVLKAHGVEPYCVAGHSLGEFGAWYAAGAFTFEDGFTLVSERGRLMDNADPDGIGAMSAVIGPGIDVVREACAAAGGTVVVANINSPQQVVISGEKAAVERAGAILLEKGAKRVLPLKVSGAFHSPLMEKARDEFAQVVNSIIVNDAKAPVYANVTAGPVIAADDIRRLMVEQLVSPVRWTESVLAMKNDGVTGALEIGPGNVLAGLIKRIDGDFAVTGVSDTAQLAEVIG